MLLLFGGFAVLVGWLIGAARLWDSPVWTTRDKVIGTLLLPGGLFTSMWILLGFVAQSCVQKGNGPVECFGGPGTLGSLALTALALSPLFTAPYLLWRVRRARGDGLLAG